MALTNQERVGKALELLKDGLVPFVIRELKAQDSQGWLNIVRQSVPETQIRLFASETAMKWDAAALLSVLWNQWQTVFRKTLGQAERSIVSELRDVRNKWAHQNPFSTDDTDRALDSIARLLTAVSASQADEVNKMKLDLRREMFDRQRRDETRKLGGSLIEAAVAGSLKPWREVATPHADVATGRYQQAEFAADLWQVYVGEGSEEYRNPEEFFRRTFLTDSLKQLLSGAALRLSGKGGDPVIQLQTNFGGGKTHSMLALFHLFSGVKPTTLSGIDAVMLDAGIQSIPASKRVVLVGNKLSPGNPETKKDGTVVRTLWGELAYQLGGKKAYARIAKDDEKATSPGDTLRTLLADHGPCLILIDEWVAYARQLHDDADLPGGSFETMFTFAQTLTEAARAVDNCMLVVSLPASDTTGSPHLHTDDVEVGGIRGRAALDRLRNVVGRMESSWRPATAEEGFEIVRRRLFEPLSAEQFKQRDLTARAFAEWYRSHTAEFPNECRTADYEKRIQSAYPIHPEIFDRLYEDWSTLVKFQRTRGVLRLMAAVIHSLWENGDKNPLILPSTIPIDDRRVQNELTRYLSDNWPPIIERDIDGSGSLPAKIDGENPNFGKLHATRRVARTIYLGSAPMAAASQRGIEDRRIKLGCVMPGESPPVFGDALRHLAQRATYLYQDGPRAWYATQPTVTKLAEDRAELLKRNPDKVAAALDAHVRANVRTAGDFAGVHASAQSGSDVADDAEVRLVVLPAEATYAKGETSAAETAARAVLESRGNTPRLYRNALVFLAADRTRVDDLQDAIRRELAWKEIIDDQTTLNLDPHQVRQAQNQLTVAESTTKARIPETYQWLLVPTQKSPGAQVELVASRLTGSDALAIRASKKLRSDDGMFTTWGATMLKRALDASPFLWRDQNHIAIRQLANDFAQQIYLQRVAGPSVIVNAVRDGVQLLTWENETFAYADSYDEKRDRYVGLRGGMHVTIDAGSAGLIVKADVARKQMAEEAAGTGRVLTPSGGTTTVPPSESAEGEENPPNRGKVQPKRYHGSVVLDSQRVGRDAGRIAEEIISHLAGLDGAEVRVTLEIQARIDSGVPDSVVRTVTENARTLKFESQGFEAE